MPRERPTYPPVQVRGSAAPSADTTQARKNVLYLRRRVAEVDLDDGVEAKEFHKLGGQCPIRRQPDAIDLKIVQGPGLQSPREVRMRHRLGKHIEITVSPSALWSEM